MVNFLEKLLRGKLNRKIVPLDFGAIILKLLIILGLPLASDPPNGKFELFLLCFKKFRIFFSLLSMLFATAGYTLWTLINHNEDPLVVLRTLPNISNHMFFLSRMVILFRNRAIIKTMFLNLTEIIESYSEKYSNLIENYYHRNRRLQICNGIFLTFIWLSQVIEFIHNYIEHGTEIFTVQIWLPFDHNGGLKYFFSCVVVMWGGVIISTNYFIGDWIIYNTITLYTLAFDIVGNEIKEILSVSTTKIEDLKEIVTKHCALMEGCEQLASIVSGILLYNSFQSIALLSLIGFQMIVLDDLTQLAVYGFLIIVVFSQMFLMSFHGQMLINSSSNVAESIYQAEWYNIEDVKVKRIIPFMMQRCQAYKYLTARGFFVISMETFTSVICILNFL